MMPYEGPELVEGPCPSCAEMMSWEVSDERIPCNVCRAEEWENLRAKLGVAKRALEKIVACDYRGNEPREQTIARLALPTAELDGVGNSKLLRAVSSLLGRDILSSGQATQAYRKIRKLIEEPDGRH